MNKKNIFVVFVLFLTIFCINTMSCRDKPKTYTVYTGSSSAEKYTELFNHEPPGNDVYKSLEINKPLFDALKAELTAVRAMMLTQAEMETYLIEKGDFGHKEAKESIKFFLKPLDDPKFPYKCLVFRDSSNKIHCFFR